MSPARYRSAHLLRELGVDLGNAGNIPPYLEFRRWNDGELIRSHEIGSWYQNRMGAPFVTMHRGTLQRMLADEVSREHIHLGHQVTGLVEEPDGVHLRIANLPDVVAKVVVGVDGVHSLMPRTLPAASGPGSGPGHRRCLYAGPPAGRGRSG